MGDGRGEQHMVRNLLLVTLATACVDDQSEGGTAQTETNMEEAAMDSGSWDGAGSEDSYSSLAPDAWAMSGELHVESGLLVPERSLVVAEVVDASGTTVCRQQAGLASSLRTTELPDDDLEAWWTLQLEVRDTSTCEAAGVAGPLPVSLSMGLGPLHPEVEAVLDSEAGAAPSEQIETKSIFVAFEEGEVWVFGLATMKPEPGVATSDAGAVHFGVEDGLWRFRAVYPFRY